ncbi:orotidine-5'-phosphate decarboxylase [Peribacillus cavernae]|uniref:Orotidine 5'-phosphate decarboxylase n=1 Tax=Peribacillus cavernae TaxID=1674310 RepID=A0A3S0VQ76_9BACI|nr:orotidine-5'-phosphate decarboxylase [Peribacillus cavernae]MDQ0217145.1 orotidine-5'-phosphate decarboxylase [Peribacillus cavernae]RUQ30381.1 orotidine-5'-phosphate decarboxylase [Peribacillus cavernae]
MNKSLIIALDFPGQKETEHFLDQFSGEQLFVKVGMELFYQNGPGIIDFIKGRGHDIFLDLKLHDIPHTVKQAMKGLAGLNVDLVNVHAAGGRKMMEAALEGLEAGTLMGKERPKCIAVTQLTSTSSDQVNQEQLINATLEESVLHYARLARLSGLDGVVCSTHEVSMIHDQVGKDFLTVTPGIRTADGDRHDQKRIATPEQARLLGTNAIVVGRSIIGAKDPVFAYKKITEAWEGIRV